MGYDNDTFLGQCSVFSKADLALPCYPTKTGQYFEYTSSLLAW